MSVDGSGAHRTWERLSGPGRLTDRDRRLIMSAAASAVVKPLTIAGALVALGYCARGLDELQFGVLATITALSGLLAFADFGLGNSLMTRLAACLSSGDMAGARALVSSGTWALTAIGSFVVALSAAAVPLVSWSEVFGVPHDDARAAGIQSAMSIFLLARAVAIPAGIGQRIHYAAEQGGRSNLWLLLGALASPVGCLWVSQEDGSLWLFVLCLVGIPVIANTLETVSVLVIEHPRLRPSVAAANRGGISSLSRLGSLYLTLGVAGAVAYQTDTLVVASVLGAATAGVFAVAARMFAAITALISGMSAQLWTATVGALAVGDVAWVRSRFKMVMVMTLIAALPANVLLIVLGRAIVRFWVGATYVPSCSLLIAFGTWSLYSCLMSQCALIMNAFELVRPQIVMATLMATANIGLSIYFTHWLGIIGPLLGSLISHVVFNGIPGAIYVRRLLSESDIEIVLPHDSEGSPLVKPL